jgi:hypothetical protein
LTKGLFLKIVWTLGYFCLNRRFRRWPTIKHRIEPLRLLKMIDRMQTCQLQAWHCTQISVCVCLQQEFTCSQKTKNNRNKFRNNVYKTQVHRSFELDKHLCH